MANKALNGKTASQNIFILMKKIKEAGLLEMLDKHIGAPGYRKMFNSFKRYLRDDISYTELPDDKVLFKNTGIASIDSKKKHFYEKLTSFAGTYSKRSEDWYKECLDILNEVDALWMMDLKDAAEIRFLDIYEHFNPQKHFSNQYSYVLSKIAYYFSYFSAQSFIDAEETHKKFLNKSFLLVIEQFEHISTHSGILDPSRPIPLLDQQSEDGAIQFYNYLVGYFNQRGDLRNELMMLQKEIKELIEKYKKEEHIHNWSLGVFHREDAQVKFPHEFLYINYFLLRLKEYHLFIRLNDRHNAKNVLEQLYRTLTTVREQTEHYMVGLYYYISTELYNMKIDLIVSGKPNEYKLDAPTFEFYQKQVENFPLRIELNQIVYEFIGNAKWDFDKALTHIQAIRDKSEKSVEINFELFLIDALIQYHKNELSEAQDRIEAAMRYAKKAGLGENDFLNIFYSFYKQLLKPRTANRYGEAFEKVYLELRTKKPEQHPIFQLLFYWIQKQIPHDFFENLLLEEAKNDPKLLGEFKKLEVDGKEVLIKPKSLRRKWK